MDEETKQPLADDEQKSENTPENDAQNSGATEQAETPEEKTAADATGENTGAPAPEQPEKTDEGDQDEPAAAAGQPQPDSNAPAPSPAAAIVTSDQPRKTHKRLIVIIAIILLVLAAGAPLAIMLTRKPATHAPHTSNTVIHPKDDAAQTPAYTFLDTPQKLGDLNFFADLAEEFGTECDQPNQTNCPPSVAASDISYYKVGSSAGGQAVIAAVDTKPSIDAFQYWALETSPQHYEILARNSDIDLSAKTADLVVSTLKKGLSSNVSVNTTDAIAELQFPSSITLDKATLKLSSYNTTGMGYFVSNLAQIRGMAHGDTPLAGSALKKLGEEDSKTYYEVTATDSANYQVKELYGALNTFYVVNYTLPDSLTPDSSKAPNITWSTGSNIQGHYTNSPSGCGSAFGYVVAKNLNTSQLIEAGKGPDGQTLYNLPLSSPLFTEIYNDDYKPGSTQSYLDKSLQNLTAQQFQDQHGVFVAKNSLGEYVVYMRSDAIITGGCGKPVVYLYPQTPEYVNVKVGAVVEKSEPAYPQAGWQNVLALPGSRLIYQGAGYPYLYWEGKGLGTYPKIDFGTVVPQAKVVTTIRQQLAAQGFNAKETADFLEYWQPRLPKDPYVRLSWLNTQQMNALAPLAITPRPATLIRTFLDFQGLAKPVQLKPQTFHAPARSGFTAVEWGGLLRDN